jgi:preprotein translocase subunit SecA
MNTMSDTSSWLNLAPTPTPAAVPATGLIGRARTLAPLTPLPQGLDALYQTVQGHWMRWRNPRSQLMAQSKRTVAAFEALIGLSDVEMQPRLEQARAWMRLDPQQADGHLEEVLAVVGQLAWRRLGLKPYAVQFMGALVLQRGLLAEMATGEGKTLTVGLAAVLAGLTGRPCHVITANDYLAGRDAEEMGPLFAACGLRVASMAGDLEPAERALRYDADVVYLTAKELLADYLRDQMGEASPAMDEQQCFAQWLRGEAPHGASALLVRGLHTAIVDEADSILIDEAVTPLILAAPRESRGLQDAVRLISDLADTLLEGPDYEAQPKGQSVTLLASAKAQLTDLSSQLPPLWRPAPRREELLRQALVVRHFFHPGQHFVVQDDEVVLLDEFTGRMTPGRSLTAGLHQAIEASEGVTITDPNQSLTQMSFQTFFRRFRKLSGCSGTIREAASEVWRVYGLQVVRVPTHRPRLTTYHAPILVRDLVQKWHAIAQEVAQELSRGRPVLVGVRSVTASEALARVLRAQGIEPRVLNALAHAEEAAIVSGAGQRGVVTIATNMAGRGTDIRLGQGVPEAGGLHVIVAEVNESGRIDRQLAGRCGRQGDFGSVSTYLCLADDLAQRMMPAPWRQLVLMVMRSSTGKTSRLAAWAFARAQHRAEAVAFQRRWSVLRSDDWMKSALPFEGRQRSQRS